jgi:hypothetical protein
MVAGSAEGSWDTLGPMRFAALLIVLLAATVASGQTQPTQGCVDVPVLTPATQAASDLHCFEPTLALTGVKTPERHISPVPFVLGSVGAIAIGTAIGFGIGAAQIDDQDTIRVMHAVANMALSVGLTALVTAVVLALVHW